MERKTKVTFDIPAIGTRPAHVKEIFGDAVVCLAVNNAVDLMDDKKMSVKSEMAYIGTGIPDPVLGKIMGSFVSTMIEEIASNKTVASFVMHEISEILESRSKAIVKNMTEHEMVFNFADEMAQLFGDLWKK